MQAPDNKHQIPNSKFQKRLNKIYDLEERTFLFARDCRVFVRSLKTTIPNIEDGKQLVRSSDSVGAN